MKFLSSMMVLVAFLLTGMMTPIHTYAQHIEAWAASNISAQSYNVSSVLASLTDLSAVFQDTIKYYKENPLLSPLLHTTDTFRALVTIQDAIQNTTPVVDTSLFPSATIIFGPGLPGSPVIYIYNLSPAPVCYHIERSSTSDLLFPQDDLCDISHDNLPELVHGIIVPPNTTAIFYPGADFIGAFNEIIGGALGTINGARTLLNCSRGARHEINYGSSTGSVFYDISYEFGFSNSQLGPSSIFPFVDVASASAGNTARKEDLSHVQGETDILTKLNKGWSTLSASEKAELAKFDTYITPASSTVNAVVKDSAGPNTAPSWLSAVKHDKGAPALVKYFYQITAGITGYVYHGSAPAEAGLTEDDLEAAMRPKADSFSWCWEVEAGEAKNMTIAAYPSWDL